MKRRSVISAALCTVLSVKAKSPLVDPRGFETQVLSAIRQLNEWKRVSQREDGRWQKRRLDITNPTYDVVKSESALRPLIGTLRMYVHNIGHAIRDAREEAEQELGIESAGPLGIDGKDWITAEYELQFEPTERGWLFFHGRCVNSMTVQLSRMNPQGGGANWYELTRAELEKKTMHAVVLLAFEPPARAKRDREPAKRTKSLAVTV